MRNPWEEQRDLYRLFEEGTGISKFRDLQKDSLRALDQYRQPYDAAVQQMLEDFRRQQEMIESTVRGILPPPPHELLNGLFPDATVVARRSVQAAARPSPSIRRRYARRPC